MPIVPVRLPRQGRVIKLSSPTDSITTNTNIDQILITKIMKRGDHVGIYGNKFAKRRYLNRNILHLQLSMCQQKPLWQFLSYNLFFVLQSVHNGMNGVKCYTENELNNNRKACHINRKNVTKGMRRIYP